MKVSEGQGPILQQVGKHGNRGKTNKDDFRKVMEQVSSIPERKEPVTDPKNLRPVINGIDIIHSAEQAQGTSDITDKKRVLGTLRETLDMVDFYASKLADSSLQAADLTPLIGHLEERLGILGTIESAANTPEKIRPVISELKVTLGTEIEKFKRGDYL